MYSLSMQGEFCSWQLEPLESKSIMRFDQPSIRLLVFKLADLVMCVFEHQIVGLDVARGTPKQVAYMSMNSLRKISDARLSNSEAMLALALSEDSENKAEIRIYQVDLQVGLVNVETIRDISSPVQIMDFTIDNTYLMYKEALGQRCFYDLLNFKRNDYLGQNFDPKFMSSGMLLSPSAANIARLQSPANRFVAFAMPTAQSLLAIDDIGTIRLFQYPSADASWTKVYQHHASAVSSVALSADGQLAVTCSSYDRLVLVWRVKPIDKNKKHNRIVVG